MNWNFDNDRPIYVQLVEKLKLFIVAGTYSSGERLPSVRDWALEAKVNPNTMQKALSELEELGLIYTQRTNGKFVTENISLIKKIKEQIALEKVNTYLNSMESLGFSKEEAITYLKIGEDK